VTATDTPLGRARHLLDVNRADDAITILARHLADYPQDATALTLLASANLQLNRADEALDSSLKALAVDPHRLTAWQHRSMALRQLGRHEEAAAAAQEFVRLAPTLWTSHYTLGLVLRGMTGRRGEALGCASRAVELAPESPDPYVLLGLLYSDAHDYARAEEYYRRALSIDPQHAFATSNLSGLELRRGRFVRAMRGFRTAAALSPQEEVFHRNIVATVLGSLVKYGLMLAVITGFAALIVAGTADSGWLPRLIVLGVVLGAWATLLVTKLRPLSRYLRRRLRSSLLASLRTGRFRLLACGFVVHQACAFTVLLDPGIGAPELLITVGNVALLGAMMAGRRLATR
jgi:tetratricopeptide (TPR) repeat protein